MEGPGVEPPSTAARRGLRVPRVPGASSDRAPGLGATGCPDGASLRGSARLREPSIGLRCGVQHGPSDRILLRGSAGLRELLPVFSRGTGRSDGSAAGASGLRCWSLLRGSAPGCSPPPGAALPVLPPRSGAPWVRDPATLQPDSAARSGGRFRRCLRTVPNGELQAASCPPLPASPGTCPGPTSPGCEPSPAFLLLPSGTAPRGGGRSLTALGAATAAGRLNGTRRLLYGGTRPGPASGGGHKSFPAYQLGHGSSRFAYPHGNAPVVAVNLGSSGGRGEVGEGPRPGHPPGILPPASPPASACIPRAFPGISPCIPRASRAPAPQLPTTILGPKTERTTI